MDHRLNQPSRREIPLENGGAPGDADPADGGTHQQCSRRGGGRQDAEHDAQCQGRVVRRGSLLLARKARRVSQGTAEVPHGVCLMISARIRYARMKSILEVPISNEKFWSKVPSAPADAIMMDLEDSATPDNKVVVREKILDALKRPDYFGGRQIIIRVNNLATPWGRDDLQAMATS